MILTYKSRNRFKWFFFISLLGKGHMKKLVVVGVILLFLGSGIPVLAQSYEKNLPQSRGNWLYVVGSGPGNHNALKNESIEFQCVERFLRNALNDEPNQKDTADIMALLDSQGIHPPKSWNLLRRVKTFSYPEDNDSWSNSFCLIVGMHEYPFCLWPSFLKLDWKLCLNAHLAFGYKKWDRPIQHVPTYSTVWTNGTQGIVSWNTSVYGSIKGI
jgi:hypothetical protein